MIIFVTALLKFRRERSARSSASANYSSPNFTHTIGSNLNRIPVALKTTNPFYRSNSTLFSYSMLIAVDLRLLWKRYMSFFANLLSSLISMQLASIRLIMTSYLEEYFIKMIWTIQSKNKTTAPVSQTQFPYKKYVIIPK